MVSLPKVQKKRFSPFTKDQLEIFLSQIEGDKLELLYCMALSTGMRQGELLALRRQDIDLELGRVHISHTLEPLNGGGFRLSPNKTELSRRILPHFDWHCAATQESLRTARRGQRTRVEVGETRVSYSHGEAARWQKRHKISTCPPRSCESTSIQIPRFEACLRNLLARARRSPNGNQRNPWALADRANGRYIHP